jgi:hypothetical protein
MRLTVRRILQFLRNDIISEYFQQIQNSIL